MIAVSKPVGMPAQSDLSRDEDAMTLTARSLADIGERSDLWLVHRLDRVVGGAMVFARNKKYAAILSELVSGRGMKKEYLAVVEGRAEGGTLSDLLYKDSRQNKSFVVDRMRKGVKEASLEYVPLAVYDDGGETLTLVRVSLHTGRFHQIRAQFSSRAMPLVGDGKYGSRNHVAAFPALYAVSLGFSVGGRNFSIKDKPNTSDYPWSLFDPSLFEI